MDLAPQLSDPCGHLDGVGPLQRDHEAGAPARRALARLLLEIRRHTGLTVGGSPGGREEGEADDEEDDERQAGQPAGRSPDEEVRVVSLVCPRVARHRLTFLINERATAISVGNPAVSRPRDPRLSVPPSRVVWLLRLPVLEQPPCRLRDPSTTNA